MISLNTNNNKSRLISFFDAILAVALTFMASQIVMPGGEMLAVADLLGLAEQLTVYLISFVAISGLWIAHNNYFSAHELSTDGVVTLLHLALMFVVTIFPFLTMLLQQHNENSVKIIFLVCYFVMEGLLGLIIVLSAGAEKKSGKKNQELMKILLKSKTAGNSEVENKENASLEKGNKQEENEDKGMEDISQLVKHFSGNEEMMMTMLMQQSGQKMDEGLAQWFMEEQRDKKQRLSFSVYTMVVYSAVIFTSVVLLMFHPFYCYIPIAGGVMALVVGYVKIGRTMRGRKESGYSCKKD